MSIAPNPAPPAFHWQRWPEAETFVLGLIDRALAGNAFAAGLAGRMAAETGTRFPDWVDHLVLGDRPGLAKELRTLGYRRVQPDQAVGAVYAHDGGMFPRLVLAAGAGPEVREVAIKVESVTDFSRAHDLGLEVVGNPMGPYRVGRLKGGRRGRLRGGRAPGLSRVRAVPRRAGPRRPDDAARGPRGAGGKATCGPQDAGGSTRTRRGSMRPRRPWIASSSGSARTWRPT